MLAHFEAAFWALKAVGEAHRNIADMVRKNDIYNDLMGRERALEDLGRIAAELAGGLGGALDAHGDGGVCVDFRLKSDPDDDQAGSVDAPANGYVGPDRPEQVA